MEKRFYKLEERIEILKDINSIVMNKVKEIKKDNKNLYKKTSKNLNNILEEKCEKISDISIYNIGKYTLLQDFLDYILDFTLISVHDCRNIDITNLKKDNEFMKYFKNIMVFTTYVELNYKYYLDTQIYVYNTFFNDIRSIILSYFIFKEPNITDTKIMNVLSFFLKGSTIITEPFDLTNDIENKINQITTGVKYEKQKPVNNDTYNPKREYNKSNRFNLMTYISNRITIKYIIEKKPQKKKTIHKRRETWRHYENGLVVYVKGCIVNEHLLVS